MGVRRLSPLALFAAMLVALAAVPAGAGELFSFEVELVRVDIPDMPGLQSFAFGQHDGVWVLVGGRRDGLHARQPPRSFPASQNNTDIYVVDPAERRVWSASVLDLPRGLAEQLQSTNMNFTQDGSSLYLIGGYGYSQTARDHITFPNFAAVDLAGLIAAVRSGAPIAAYVRQIADPLFAVTGGQLGKIGSELYLVGGHRFDGRYNPMGMMNARQAYTNQIRVFSVDQTGDALRVDLVRTWTDAEHLRRRDYNLVPQVFPDGSEGYTISAGVFQAHADLPFLYPVDVTAGGYAPVPGFEQLLSHYHSPKLSIYDEATGEMHSLFFGGIAQYYYRDAELVRDDFVPFVDTVSRVTRAPDGSLAEYVLPVRMPGLLGASGEFIANVALLRAGSKVFRAADIAAASAGGRPAVVGHIVGGIRSPELNPFFSNRTHLTSADSSVYEVRLILRDAVHRAVSTE